MSNFISHLQINNYKSIKKLDLECSRINILIGEPNVGKSNILEALDLHFLSWMLAQNEGRINQGFQPIDVKNYFRVNEVTDLFHLGDLSQSIFLNGFNFLDYTLQMKDEGGEKYFEISTAKGSLFEINNDFTPRNGIGFFSSPVTPYRYKEDIESHDSSNYLNQLMPPFGNNIGSVILHNPSIQEFMEVLATNSNTPFEFNIDKKSKEITVQLRVNKGLVFKIPYSSLADTFRRILFYISAIRADNGYVITLEEPEAHSFPPYISYLADEIINKDNRQFFIATHSPYLLNKLIEKTPESELAVFVCGYDKVNLQTTAKKLSQTDLSELLDYGVDIFFNINRYLDDRVEYSS
jgi:AAA15 family ATPase/GTPase